MDRVVLDTNVVAKLFLDEEGSEIAARMKDAHIGGKIEAVLPSLTKYELANVLRYKDFGREEIKEAMEVIRDYAFSVIDIDEQVVNKMIDFSVEYNISAYDAAYVALAYHIGAPFYTADRKIPLKLKGLDFVKHLDQFSL